VTRRRFRSEEEFEAWLRRRRILYWIITAIGIALIVIGCILKYSSPPVVGDVASILGLVVTLYGLFTSRDEEIIGRLENTEVELHEGFERLEKEIHDGVSRLERELREGFVRLEREFREGFSGLEVLLREIRDELRRSRS